MHCSALTANLHVSYVENPTPCNALDKSMFFRRPLTQKKVGRAFLASRFYRLLIFFRQLPSASSRVKNHTGFRLSSVLDNLATPCNALMKNLGFIRQGVAKMKIFFRHKISIKISEGFFWGKISHFELGALFCQKKRIRNNSMKFDGLTPLYKGDIGYPSEKNLENRLF